MIKKGLFNFKKNLSSFQVVENKILLYLEKMGWRFLHDFRRRVRAMAICATTPLAQKKRPGKPGRRTGVEKGFIRP